MRAVDAIVERRIEEARQLGYFDNLPGTGKPIPDLDTQRTAGWWGERFAKRERHHLLREELVASVRRALPALQRADGADQAAQLTELNARIAGYNRITTVTPLPMVEVDVHWAPSSVDR